MTQVGALEQILATPDRCQHISALTYSFKGGGRIYWVRIIDLGAFLNAADFIPPPCPKGMDHRTVLALICALHRSSSRTQALFVASRIAVRSRAVLLLRNSAR